MSNDGNRICLDATPGNEHIEVCDQYGNQVVLHASNELITIFTPYKCSFMELGKTSYKEPGYGVYIHTDGKYKVKAKDQYIKEIDSDSITTVKANYETNVEGNYETSVRGNYGTLVRGNYNLDVAHRYKARIQGLKTETLIGGKASAILGKKAEVVTGVKTQSCLGLKVACDLGGKTGVVAVKDWMAYDSKTEKVKGMIKEVADSITLLAGRVNTVINHVYSLEAKVVNLCNGNMTVKQ